MAVLCRSTSFQPFFCRPASFFTRFHDFGKKGEKKGAQKWRNGKGKKSDLSRSFPVPVFYLSFPGTSLMGRQALGELQRDQLPRFPAK